MHVQPFGVSKISQVAGINRADQFQILSNAWGMEKKGRTATEVRGQVPAHIVFDSLFPATSIVEVVSWKFSAGGVWSLCVMFCFFWVDVDYLAHN